MQDSNLERSKIILTAFLAMAAVVFLPRLWGICYQRAIVYADGERWDREWRQKAYQRSQDCYNYRQNPEQYLARGAINKRQYRYIKRHGYLADCNEIMALR